MINSPPPSLEIRYPFMLRDPREGLTLPQRRAYFTFLNEAAKASSGASYARYLTVYPIDENAKAVEVDAKAVELIEASKVSQMPEELLIRLNRDEVRDLLISTLPPRAERKCKCK